MAYGEDAPAEKVSRKKGYEPDDDKDYQLSRVSFDSAENGVVVECSYVLKDEIKAKMEKQSRDGGKYYGSYCEPEKHVFEDKADAKKFVMAELDRMWAEEEGE